nr:RNA-directed DNA polymerase, eukaryota, reverse transcriptase zinc-binding domain protein [Tanacetum cinerariifolium]
MVSSDVFVIKAFWGNMLFDFATSSARGKSGGILCVWDKSLFHKKRTYATEHCLCVECTWIANNSDLLFISVYSPQELSLKRALWTYMAGIINCWHGEVIIMGDFNEVCNASERYGSSFRSLNAAEFNMFIANSYLIDIPLGVVSNKGVKRAIWDCGSDKSLGPDGFTFEFFKKYWYVVGGDVINAVKECFNSSSFPKGCNSSFIALIPKARKEKCLLFEVDFRKDFDSVRWDHLNDILGKFGFENKWRGWIRGCLNSSKASVLVNESLTDEFSFHRGLRLHGVGVRNTDVHLMADSFGCLGNNLPLTYLGVKVGDNMERVNSWIEVVKKVSNKLSSWKAKSLSVGGRLTLIKSVLGAIPTYYMSLFKVPEGILSHLEKLRNKFFLGADPDDHKVTWVSWKKVLVHKNQGGIGVNSLYALNLVLMFKWIWSFLSSLSNPFMAPTVTCSFRWPPRSGIELLRFFELVQLLTSVTLSSASDRWSWTLHGLGVLCVKSAREEIDKHVLVIASLHTIWSKVLPIKLNIFWWCMLLDRLPTMSNLYNRGIDIPCVLCPNCKAGIESRNHLFFSCSMSLDLVRLFGHWWNIHVPSFGDPSSWDSWVKGLTITSFQKRIIEASFVSMWWHIWKFRNISLFSLEKP